MNHRLGQHRTSHKTNRKSKFIQEMKDDSTVLIVELEKKEGLTKTEMRKLEQKWIDKLHPTLNTYYAYRPKAEYGKEYRRTHKKELNEKQRRLYWDNPEKFRRQDRERRMRLSPEERREKNKVKSDRVKYEVTCECGSTYQKMEEWRHKKTKKHTHFLEYGHKEKEGRNVIITCECGGKVSKRHIARHKKSSRHKNNIMY